jgi:IMP dehydrogenase
MEKTTIRQALTFDDVLLVPHHARVHPADVSIGARFARGIHLAAPLVSAAMDTVTEHRMAIAMARDGGIGIIHKNMPIDAQCAQVDRVKRSESGMIMDPITLGPDSRLRDATILMSEFSISGVPIVDPTGNLVGILTNRDLVFETDLDRPVREVMTHENLVTAPEGTSLEGAEEILRSHKIEKLPVVDDGGRLCGLITVKDIFKRRAHPNASKDAHGRLLVGAATGTARADLDRAVALVEAGTDVVVVDSAHGHSQGVLDAVERIREALPDTQLVAGNVATAKGSRALVERGVDAVKVGIGPGSICTTRVVTGVGVPQVTAIMDAVRGADGEVQSAGCGGRCLYARLDARGNGGEPRRGVPAGGTTLQADPRHGIVVGDGGGLGRSVFSGIVGATEAGSRGHRGSRAVQGSGYRYALPAAGRSAERYGILRSVIDRGAAAGGRVRADHGRRSTGVASARRGHHA